MTASRPIMQSPPGAEVLIDGRRRLYFAGTAYLGLQSHREVIRAACEAVQQYGVGAATSRAGFGHQPPTLDVEAAAATFFSHSAAFYMPSGYGAPAAMLAARAGQFHIAFVDDQSHYSVQEAVRGCGALVINYAHRDAGDLRKKLRTGLRAGQRPAVFCDGVSPATGRVAPVNDLLDVLARFSGASLILDDAHGMGVLGTHGRGTFEYFDRSPAEINHPTGSTGGVLLFSCGTLSKALGGYGGIITGEADFIDHLKSTSHHYDGCSAPPAPLAAASARALRLLMDDPTPLLKLHNNARHLRNGLLHIGLDIEEQPTPIVTVDLGDEDLMLRVQRELMQRDIAIGFMQYPGTGGRGLLRIAVSAAHSTKMIDHLLDHLRQCL
jgi:8-amino-7-oxononanoate synthase